VPEAAAILARLDAIKRTPVNRHYRPQIAALWTERFRKICELAPTRWRCIQERICKSQDPGRSACPQCCELHDLQSLLQLHFNIRPWCTLPDDFVEPDGLGPATVGGLVDERARNWARGSAAAALAENADRMSGAARLRR
jgi:hypothetical protein